MKCGLNGKKDRNLNRLGKECKLLIYNRLKACEIYFAGFFAWRGNRIRSKEVNIYKILNFCQTIATWSFTSWQNF